MTTGDARLIRRHHLVFILLLATAVAAAAALGFGVMRDSRVISSAVIDRPPPRFTLPPLTAGERGLSDSDLHGQISVVNIFASWCAPCRIEHPLIMRLAKVEGIPVYGINYKDRPDEARAWLARLGNPYSRIGADFDGRVSIDWGVPGLPATFIVDRRGRIRYQHIGRIQKADLEDRVLPVIRRLQAGKL